MKVANEFCFRILKIRCVSFQKQNKNLCEGVIAHRTTLSTSDSPDFLCVMFFFTQPNCQHTLSCVIQLPAYYKMLTEENISLLWKMMFCPTGDTWWKEKGSKVGLKLQINLCSLCYRACKTEEIPACFSYIGSPILCTLWSRQVWSLVHEESYWERTD